MSADSPSDLARRGIAEAGLIADASAHLTAEVAMHLAFEQLGPFKTYLKKFFSSGSWTDADAEGLADLVGEGTGWWEHRLGPFVMAHGWDAGRYRLTASGDPESHRSSIFDRAFSGPVIPEPTPHPRKVKFTTGGRPAPGIWHVGGDSPEDPRAAAVLALPGVSDVMVAGHFVTIGLHRSESWEERLDEMIEIVTQLFWSGDSAAVDEDYSRNEMIAEARTGVSIDDLHMMDPDAPEARVAIEEALTASDPRVRRVALAVAAESDDTAWVVDTLADGYRDPARIVRRMAIDAAGDREDEPFRPLLEAAAGDEDAWIRWRALRGIRDIGVGASRATVTALASDPDFQVRFEAEAARRELSD